MVRRDHTYPDVLYDGFVSGSCYPERCAYPYDQLWIKYGFEFANGIGAKGFYPSLLWLSKKYMYLPIPIAGIAMVIFEAESLFNNILKLMGKEQLIQREESLEEQVSKGENEQ